MSIARWNLKEAAGKALARRTGTAYEAVMLGERANRLKARILSGKHPSVVAAQLGHSTVMTTLDVYSHVLPGLQESAARSLETFLPKQLPAGDR